MIATCPKRQAPEKLYRSVCLGIQLALRKYRDAADDAGRAVVRPDLQRWRDVLYSTKCPTAGPYLKEHGETLLELAELLLRKALERKKKMDPTVTFNTMLHEEQQGNLEEANQYAAYLLEWIRKGGFPPNNMTCELTMEHIARVQNACNITCLEN